MRRAYVNANQIIDLIMPYSEVCMHLKVAGTRRTVQVFPGGVQILNADGTPFSACVTHGEAGIWHADQAIEDADFVTSNAAD